MRWGFDDLDEDGGILGFIFRQEIRASKRSFMDSVVYYSLIIICFAALGVVYVFLATPQFKATFSSSIYPKMNAICLDDGPFGALIAPYVGGTVNFVLSDQSCCYARGQIHVKLTDRDIENWHAMTNGLRIWCKMRIWCHPIAHLGFRCLSCLRFWRCWFVCV